jgi:hypothetical protein
MGISSGKEKKIYTFADYERLPEGAPYQLIGGELLMTPSPIPYHQDIARTLVTPIFIIKKYPNPLFHNLVLGYKSLLKST